MAVSCRAARPRERVCTRARGAVALLAMAAGSLSSDLSVATYCHGKTAHLVGG
jgi:hypothetical protein